jgi:hypothetical protein
VPYNKEIPNNKMPEENADERIIFIAPSEAVFFSRSKFIYFLIENFFLIIDTTNCH